MIILFDLDGTLIDSTDVIVNTFNYSYDIHHAQRPNAQDVINLIGYPLDIMYEKLGVKRADVWDFVATYKQRYKIVANEQTLLFSFAKQTVLKASKFAKLGIVTTKTGVYSRSLMEHFDLIRYFDVLIGSEDVTHHKPNAEPILKALKSFDTKNEEIWMIGDTKLDIIAANNANVNSIAVLSGYGEKIDLEKYTKFVMKDALVAIEYLEAKSRF